MCEICYKLTIKSLEQRHYGSFIVDFDQISHIALLFDRITSTRIKYWKDFFKQNCSSSTFIKKKKEHSSVAESY